MTTDPATPIDFPRPARQRLRRVSMLTAGFIVVTTIGVYLARAVREARRAAEMSVVT